METGKPGLVSAPVQSRSVAARTERKMDIQAPLTAFYIHTVPALAPQPHVQPPAAAREPAALHLAMPPLYSKETLPFLTLHIAGGLQSYSQELSLAAAATTARPKLTGKHVCPHCGRDCMKPSVLEKHLRCHTGERPYPCTTCGVSFKTQSNLYKHKRTQAHARLSSESEQSSLGSQDSMSSSRESCGPSLSRDQSEESGSLEKNATAAAGEVTGPAISEKEPPAGHPDNEQNLFVRASHKTDANESSEQLKEKEKQQKMGNEKPSLTVNRHLPIQRQEATLFSKQWESSVSRGKSQNHESTDSGFSESSDHYPSPGSVLLDHSMDSLTESATEHLEEPSSSCRPLEAGPRGQELKGTAREQEQKMLEEHISKLISQNSAVVEDKHLENVRPRKTVLSKQGSIDLPMPYTYKDSFHFDMRISKASNVGLHRNMKPGLYSSVPTQRSTTIDTMEHAPLTRSNSLPFSVSLLQPERSSPSSSYQSDYVTLVRRGSSGQINPTGFAMKPVNQQTSNHRPLVRQTAVDCNHATDGIFANSSVEEACTSDICGEQSNRKFRRKKSQKFAYNKWYMYGGGTFKKLYNADKGDNNVTKGRKSLTNPELEVQGIQKRSSAVRKDPVTTTGSTVNATSSSAVVLPQPCYAPVNQPPASTLDFNQKLSHLHSSHTSLKAPLRRNLSLSTLQLTSTGSLVLHNADSIGRAEGDEDKHTESVSKLFIAHIPSESKKQRTDDKIICPVEMETEPKASTQHPASAAGIVTQQDTNLTYINLQAHPAHNQLKAALFPPCISAKGASPCTPVPCTAKSSFLPKYQLKLPNATGPDSNTSHASESDDHSFTFAPLSPHANETPTPSKTSERQRTDPLSPPLVQTHIMKKANSFHSTRGLPLFPLPAASFCEAKTSVSALSQNHSSNPAALCRQFATTTATTTCVRDNNAALCNTSVQFSTAKPAVSSGSSGPPAVMQNVNTTTIRTTEGNQLSAPIAASSQAQYPSLIPTSSSTTNPVNRANPASNSPVVPCQIVPFDLMQPAIPNVFHVHTADLQICLQIISDEQLALIEPQIERQSGDVEVIQAEAQSLVNMESTNECRDHEKKEEVHQKEMDRNNSTHSLNTEIIKPPSVPNTSMAEHSDSSQLDLRKSDESQPPKALGASSRPHKYSQVTAAPETVRSAGKTAVLLKGVMSGMSQTSEEEQALPLTEDQGGLESDLHSTVKQQKESQQTLKHNEGTMQTDCKAESGGPASAAGANELPLTVRNCKAPREVNPHHPMESGIMKSEIPHSCKHANRDGLSDATPHQSQHRISSAHSNKHLAQFTSSSCRVHADRPSDVTATQSPTAAVLQGGSLTTCAAWKEQGTREQEGAPRQSDGADREPNRSQEASQTDHQRVEAQDSAGAPGQENVRMRSSESAESSCRHTADRTKQEGEERTTAEQNLHNLSQTHSGMSEPQMPQQGVSTLNDLNSPASSPAGLLYSPQHEMEMNPFYFSQHHWDVSAAHTQQTQMLCEANSAQQIHPRAPTAETQSAFSQIVSGFQQTQLHVADEMQAQQQEWSCAALRVLHSTAANAGVTANLTKGSTLGSQTCATSSSALKLSPYSQSGHVDVSKDTGGMTGECQASNRTPCSSTYPEPDGQCGGEDQATHAHVSHGAQSVNGDVTNRCQSLFLAGQLHGYQPLECLRPLQSCQDYADDTSSSDDEGKLIIEL